MKSRLKKALVIVFSIIIIICFAIFIAYRMLVNPLPDYDGEYQVSGIKETVNIFRDENGVPIIEARNDEDAAFALGFVHAQERLFQMDLGRRAGEGRLSEIIGSKTVPYDKMFRTLGLYKAAQEQFKNLKPLSRKILIAYAKGVNAYIRKSKGNYAIEFDVLGYDPYEWKPEHTLVLAKLMAWELNISWWSDITFTDLVQKFGSSKAEELLPHYPENSPTIIPARISKYSKAAVELIKTDRAFRKFIGFGGTHIGSNNWVINGKLSESGKPIIANDVHLAFQAPGRWFVAVIRSNEWNAEGFTIPGIPAIIIGKNKHISWVVTNVMADDADFYIEQLNSTGEKYLIDGKWKKLTSAKEIIMVKDSAFVEFHVLKDHRGPIISDIHPYNFLFKSSVHEKSAISMRWTALDISDDLFGVLSVNKASNWTEFKNALKYFTVPGQNFVYADEAGNIGYICAVKIPKRKFDSPTLIYDGTTSESDWTGFVPYSRMPKLYNPSDSYIASANNKTVKNFKYHLSNVWDPPSRIIRIKELLHSKEKFSLNDFRKFQTDIFSPYAEDIVPYILKAFDKAEVNDENLKLALELFRKWSFEMDRYSQAPTIYAVFLQKFLENTFLDEMGRELLNEYLFLPNICYKIIPEILQKPNSSWFDNSNTDEIEDRNDIVRKSLVDALVELENRFGKNLADWQWGEQHKVIFKHPFSGISKILDPLINIGSYGVGGDGTTVFNTEYLFTNPYENILGPSMRFIYDFSNPDEFKYVLPTGQSGQIMSSHYKDMTTKWLNGELITLKIKKEEYEHFPLLKLFPKKINE